MDPQWTSKPHGYWSLFHVSHCSCPVSSSLSQTVSLIFISIIKVKKKTPTTLPPPKKKKRKKTAICFKKDSRGGPLCLVVDPAGCGRLLKASSSPWSAGKRKLCSCLGLSSPHGGVEGIRPIVFFCSPLSRVESVLSYMVVSDEYFSSACI